jgi:hypothetical protein
VKRIDIEYGGQMYRSGQHDLGELQAEIADGVRSGSYWLLVADGEGQGNDAYLHLSAGVPIVLIPIPDELPTVA